MESIEDKIDKKKQPLEKYNERIREQKGAATSLHEIDSIVKKTISGKISMAALKRAPTRSRSSYNSCSTPNQRSRSSPETVICRVARCVT